MNKQHLEAVSRILAQCAEVRSKKIRDAGLSGSEQWRLVASAAARQNLDLLERNILGPFALVWLRDFGPKGPLQNVRLDLSEADLSGNVFASSMHMQSPLEGACLRNARLDDTEWLCLPLRRTDFTGASCRNSFILKINCRGAVFRNADLSGTHLLYLETERNPPDFSGANLSGARIVLRGPLQLKLDDAKMEGCQITYVTPKTEEDKAFSDKVLEEFLSGLDETQRAQIIIERPNVEKSGRCFIATAACGTDQSDEVILLQSFRELGLRQTAVGRMLITLYDWVSPKLAEHIERSALARMLVLRMFIRPAARFSARLLRIRKPANS